MRVGGLLILVCLVLAVAPAATADGTPAGSWLPHAADATWTYQFTDSVYNTTPTTEHVSVVKTNGSEFTLGWTIDGGTNTNNCQYGTAATSRSCPRIRPPERPGPAGRAESRTRSLE